MYSLIPSHLILDIDDKSIAATPESLAYLFYL